MSAAMNIRILAAGIGLMALAAAQQVIAPTPEPVGKTRGDDWNGYNIVDSFETGYRFRTVGGNFSQYRSNENFGDGVRLLSSFLTVNSKDGHGRFFDEIVLTTQGLGNDPYESATLRVQKNKLYRYDLLWRENQYFNPGLASGGANGLHLLDTNYTLQDHDLTLFPQSRFKFFLGYTHSLQTGPAISSEQFFDARGDEFPFFANVRRSRNEYRVGNEFSFFGVKVNWLRGWDDFKEDTPFDLLSPSAGANPNDLTTLTSFTRREPFHGTSPYWRVALFAERKLFAVNGRFTYTAGQRAFVLDESAIGTSRFGAGANRQVVTLGNGQRPVATGNLNISLFPNSRLTITNSTSIYNVRTEGESAFVEFDNALQTANLLYFQYLGIRTIANETDANYQATQWLSVFGGYHYSDRLIRSIEQITVQGSPETVPFEQTNHLNSGVFGVRLRPVKPLTILVDGEIGRADRPFTPVSERDYHVLGARVQYRWKTLQLSGFTRENYNNNSVTLSAFSSHSRQYSFDASWAPRGWVSFDAGYSKLHLNTVGGIAYFANARFIQGEQSIYISNLHAGNLGLRFGLNKRADLYLGYTHVQDTGDGRSTPTGVGIGSALPVFQAAQTFPLTFESPLARFSLRISEKIRWNLGYQYYGYHEEFFNRDNYRAHTGYSSVLWSF
jgi:hypothetical protein